MSGDTSDFVCETVVFMEVVLYEHGVGVLCLELVDLWDDFLAFFAAFVPRYNDCHLSFRHLHDLSKGCAIREILDSFDDLRLDGLLLFDDLRLDGLWLFDDFRLDVLLLFDDLRLDGLWLFDDFRLDVFLLFDDFRLDGLWLVDNFRNY